MLIVFPNVHWALTAEEVLLTEKIEHEVVPIPPHISGGCGLGIRIAPERKDSVLAVFQAEAVKVDQVLEQ